jgi:hypothetical protein
VAVDLDDLPAIGGEPGADVLAEGQRTGAIDGDVVGVIQRDQAAELEVASQGAGLAGDALHQAAVAGQHVGVVVDQIRAEARPEQALRHGEAHRVGDALAQRAGGGLDALDVAVLWVAVGGVAPLAEVADVLQRDRLAAVPLAVLEPGQVDHAVEEHAGVAVREDDPIPVRPVRVRRVILQEAAPEHRGHVRHPHRRAGVP